LVFVGGYSYERNGKTINVKSYTRRKSTWAKQLTRLK
jgi:hypothetical protein